MLLFLPRTGTIDMPKELEEYMGKYEAGRGLVVSPRRPEQG